MQISLYFFFQTVCLKARPQVWSDAVGSAPVSLCKSCVAPPSFFDSLLCEAKVSPQSWVLSADQRCVCFFFLLFSFSISLYNNKRSQSRQIPRFINECCHIYSFFFLPPPCCFSWNLKCQTNMKTSSCIRRTPHVNVVDDIFRTLWQ